MPAPDGADGYSRQTTAEKLVRLLEALAANENGIGVREVARDAGMDKSAVSRLLDQLTSLGIAAQDPASARFHPGPRLFALGATVHGRDTLWHAAEPILRELAAQFNETCYLATREGFEVVFRDKVDCTHHVRYVIDPGERVQLHAGAGGRAVLAGLGPEELETFLAAAHLPRLTEHTITESAELRRQVGEDRRRGYSVSLGERVVGGSAVAAPYFQAGGSCRGAIVFTCPEVRFDVRRLPEIADAVVDAARRLSQRLGHRAPGRRGPRDGGRLTRSAGPAT